MDCVVFYIIRDYIKFLEPVGKSGAASLQLWSSTGTKFLKKSQFTPLAIIAACSMVLE